MRCLTVGAKALSTQKARADRINPTYCKGYETGVSESPDVFLWCLHRLLSGAKLVFFRETH